jgi:hypothetical protein
VRDVARFQMCEMSCEKLASAQETSAFEEDDFESEEYETTNVLTEEQVRECVKLCSLASLCPASNEIYQ